MCVYIYWIHQIEYAFVFCFFFLFWSFFFSFFFFAENKLCLIELNWMHNIRPLVWTREKLRPRRIVQYYFPYMYLSLDPLYLTMCNEMKDPIQYMWCAYAILTGCFCSRGYCEMWSPPSCEGEETCNKKRVFFFVFVHMAILDVGLDNWHIRHMI